MYRSFTFISLWYGLTLNERIEIEIGSILNDSKSILDETSNTGTVSLVCDFRYFFIFYTE